MKKLMILAAVAAMAFGAKADWFMWSADGEYGESWTGGYIGADADVYAYLYLGTVSATSSEFVLGDAKYLDWSKQDDSSYSFGSPTTKVFSDNLTSIEPGQKYSIILLEVASENRERHYAILSGESTSGSDYALFNNSQILSQGNWKTTSADAPVPAPEPTSSLMMLIGLAGLALKRKVQG